MLLRSSEASCMSAAITGIGQARRSEAHLPDARCVAFTSDKVWVAGASSATATSKLNSAAGKALGWLRRFYPGLGSIDTAISGRYWVRPARCSTAATIHLCTPSNM